MQRLIRLQSLIIILVGGFVTAETNTVRIEVGDTKINVHAPLDFYEISELSPETRKYFEIMTPPSNSLLAVFVSEDDLGRIMKGESPNLQRYMILQTPRNFANNNISEMQFNQLVTYLKEQHNMLLSDMKDKIGSYLDDAADQISKDKDISLDMKIGQQVPLGILFEKLGILSFVNLIKFQVTVDGKSVDSVVVASTSLLKVKDRILYAYVYSIYDNQEDINWVRAKTKEWMDLILEKDIISKTEQSVEPPSLSNSTTYTSTNFVKINLPKGVSIELPKNWVVISNDQRITLDTVVESGLDLAGIDQGISDFPFAANYYKSNETIGIVNIRYYPNVDLEQNDVDQSSLENINELDAALKDSVIKSMTAFGASVSSWEGTQRKTINGIMSFVTEYHRVSQDGVDVFRVRLIRVFAGDRSFTLTVSYNEKESLFLKTITDRIINSLMLSGIKESQVSNLQPLIKNTANSESVMSQVYGDNWVAILIFSALLTWGIGLTPPLVIRFLIVRKPIGKGWALGIVVIFLFINIIFFSALRELLFDSTSKTHSSLYFVALVSYAILRKNTKKSLMAKHEGQINPEPKKEDNNSVDSIGRRLSQIEQRMELPYDEAEKESISEELSSLRDTLDTREVKRETKVEEIRITLEEDLREKNAIKGEQDFLPTFQKWLEYSGNVRLDRTEAFVVYCGELERLYKEKLSRIE
jgi:hypothetical protein